MPPHAYAALRKPSRTACPPSPFAGLDPDDFAILVGKTAVGRAPTTSPQPCQPPPATAPRRLGPSKRRKPAFRRSKPKPNDGAEAGTLRRCRVILPRPEHGRGRSRPCRQRPQNAAAAGERTATATAGPDVRRRAPAAQRTSSSARFNRSELPMTESELAVMAMTPIMGCSRPIAAIGIAAAL